MSATLQQIYALNPTTVVGDNDLFYLVQSPYTPGTDAGIKGSDLKSLFVLSTAIINPAHGGTGINNGTSTIAIGGNVSFIGAFSFAGTLTGNTAVTFPTSGTLATTAQLPVFPLALSLGGTGANLTASNGGIFYSTATAGAILSGTATAGQLLRSGSNSAPSWSITTYPATNSINTLLYASSANVISELATVNNAVLTTSAGGVPTWSLSTGFANAPVNTNITSMTGLTGYLQAPQGFKDVNGNIALNITAQASAVNFIQIGNAATGSLPSIASQGSDSVVPLNLLSKGGGFVLQDAGLTNGAQLAFRNAAGSFATSLQVAAGQSTNLNLQLPSLAPTINGQALVSTTAGVMSFSSTPISTVPQRTVYTSGSGTYTVPTGALWLEVELCGGGGGGQGGGTGSPGTGIAGTASTFSTLTAGGGTNGSGGGTGGTASGGDINLVGGAGGQLGTALNQGGANGGVTVFGGAANGIFNNASNSQANTGAGGASGAVTTGASNPFAGGAGGYVRKLIASPAASYSYSVGGGGSGGAAGTGGTIGGNGGSGIIIVTAHFQ